MERKLAYENYSGDVLKEILVLVFNFSQNNFHTPRRLP
jgi:hypothetical protein